MHTRALALALPAWMIAAATALWGCGGAAPPPDAGGTPTQDGGPVGHPVSPLGLHFDRLEPFLVPTQDWIAQQQAARGGALDFERAILALFVHRDRLYLGYGDATLNLGPIEVRAFSDVAAPPAAEMSVDEEAIDLYRRDGEDLWIPGVDGRENDLEGNVYVRRGDAPWEKYRGLVGALHVHDVAVWGGAVYAAGSGAPTYDEYLAVRIRAYLWRSRDGGRTWEVAFERQNDGDIRFTHLVPLADGLYVFGYRTDGQGTVVEMLPHRTDGTSLTPLSELRAAFVLGAWQVGPSRALLRAIDASAQPLQVRAYVVEDSHAQVVGGPLANEALLDAAVQGDGSVLLLTRDGTLREEGDPPYGIHLHATADLAAFEPLVQQEMEVMPTTVAYWRGALYLGRRDGALWRALRLP